MLREGPLHVLAHNGRRVLRAIAQRLDQRLRGRRIAECHGDVAQPSLIPDAADGTALRALEKLRFAPGEKLGEPRLVQAMPYGEVFFGRRSREFVPGTNQLAVVAPVNAIADGAAKFEWNGPFELDGEIGNAAARIEP